MLNERSFAFSQSPACFVISTLKHCFPTEASAVNVFPALLSHSFFPPLIHIFSCCLAQFLESQFKGPKQFDILIYLPHSGFVCNCCCHSCCCQSCWCWCCCCCLAIVAAAMAATVAAVAWHKHNRLIGSARRTWLWLRTEAAAKLRLVNGKLMLL